MNGVEVEGQFEQWDHPISCAHGVDWERRDKNKFKRVSFERSLATFSFSDKDGTVSTYIDGIKVDNSLYKTYPIVIIDGLKTIDSSTYVLRKTTRGEYTASNGEVIPSINVVSNFFINGVKGPDFHTISNIGYDPKDGSFIYLGSTDASRRDSYAVIDGKTVNEYPVSRHWNYGRLRKSKYGEPYFKFDGDQTEGYWINGEAFACDGRPKEISFLSKGRFKFICKKNEETYFLVTNDSVSGPFRYIGFREGNRLWQDSSMIMIDEDSIYCYHDDKIVYSNRFSMSGSVTRMSFRMTTDKKTIIIQESVIGQTSFFIINDKRYMTETLPPEGYIMHVSQRYVANFLGFSETGNKYAYLEYILDEETGLNKWANIYINDSLLGKFPHTITFEWTTGDNFRLSDYDGRFIANRENGTEFEKDNYKRFVDNYYPDGVPSIIYEINPRDMIFEVKELPNKERYERNMEGILIRGRQIKHQGKSITVGLLENDKIYYTLRDENRTWLYVDWKLIYASDRIFSITLSDGFLNYYSYEGNKVYWLKYAL